MLAGSARRTHRVLGMAPTLLPNPHSTGGPLRQHEGKEVILRPGSLPTTSMVFLVMPWLAVRQGWKHVARQLLCVSITMGTCCHVARCRHRHQLTALFGPTCTLAKPCP